VWTETGQDRRTPTDRQKDRQTDQNKEKKREPKMADGIRGASFAGCGHDKKKPAKRKHVCIHSLGHASKDPHPQEVNASKQRQPINEFHHHYSIKTKTILQHAK
jgi:hypothetical protein